MTKRTMMMIGIAGAALASAAFALPPGGPGCSKRHGPGERIERAVSEAGLSAPTEDRVFAILDDARKEGRTLRREIRSAHDDLRELLSADTPDEDAVLAQADVVGTLMAKAHKHRLETLLAVRGVTTVEEWRELRDGFEERRGPGR